MNPCAVSTCPRPGTEEVTFRLSHAAFVREDYCRRHAEPYRRGLASCPVDVEQRRNR